MSKPKIFKDLMLLKKWHSKNRQVGKNRSLFQSTAKKFGLVQICSLVHRNLTANQIESGRRLIRRTIKKKGKLFVHIYAYLGRTTKPSGIRMGNGKGVKGRDKICLIKPGKVLYSIKGVKPLIAKNALLQLRYKFGFSTRIFYR